MDLHDFRRQWQQQPPGPIHTDLTHQKLQAMLANQPETPVSAMLYNARRDQRLILFVIIINLGNLMNLGRRHVHGTSLTLLFVTFALMILVTSWEAYRQRQLIRRLQSGDSTTYGYVRESIRQLRTLMRNKLYVAVAFLTTLALVIGYSRYEAILHALRAGTIDWGLTLLGALTTVGLLAGLLYFQQERQQRRYGQHLDRLEATLRELDETA